MLRAAVASDAHFASALQKVQVNLTFHSLIRIFTINREDTWRLGIKK